MSPGPCSDSYDPEFGTAEHAEAVRLAICGVRAALDRIIAAPPRDIVALCLDTSSPWPNYPATLTEKQWRVLRFAVNRALETL